ncbi:hypothetical protein BT63DRAFT_455343 [Microthyrium microscopicum]|uniref:Uncharacterized protein n=1 Tax=Microthyrium microscopicum TaxID=703497 RepID=A0A6A6UBR9_9PEZI|nr:hypothetical protein BT63DRAFT_455343 [Microthyrium microscopicum]
MVGYTKPKSQTHTASHITLKEVDQAKTRNHIRTPHRKRPSSLTVRQPLTWHETRTTNTSQPRLMYTTPYNRHRRRQIGTKKRSRRNINKTKKSLAAGIDTPPFPSKNHTKKLNATLTHKTSSHSYCHITPTPTHQHSSNFPSF